MIGDQRPVELGRELLAAPSRGVYPYTRVFFQKWQKRMEIENKEADISLFGAE
jgi:hypothetical protein